MTGIIDVHAHFLPVAYRDALAERGIDELDGGMPIPDWSAEQALAMMDSAGVATAILSVSSPGLNIVESPVEAGLARSINTAAADLKWRHDGRFGGFATLPMGDAAAAVDEIGYALDVLGLDGFILETNHHGRYPADPAFAPVLAALDARAALVLLHPTSPACGCSLLGRPAPLIEFPFETVRAVTDLILTGTLARYPRIRFILAHGGGALPFLSERIAGFANFPGAWQAHGIGPNEVREQLARLYYDTALAAGPAQIAALRTIVPDDHILFGSDWPFSPAPLLAGSIASLRGNAALSEETREAILGGNARRLLGGDA